MRTTRSILWSPRRTAATIAAVAVLVASWAVAIAVAAPAPRVGASTTPWPYTATVTSGPRQGQVVNLQQLGNLALEDVGTQVGQAILHVNVASSPYQCLDGSTLNVFSLNGQDFVHNGLQGSQCAYGTWEIVPSAIVTPNQMPSIGSAGLSSNGFTAAWATLHLVGENLGSTTGSVLLIPEGASSTGPAQGMSIVSWSPTAVTANAPVPPSTNVTQFYALLLTSTGAAAGVQVSGSSGAPGRVVRLGIGPGTRVLISPGSLVATIGTRIVHLPVAPEMRGRVLLAPAGFLASLVGAAKSWDSGTRQLRLATARTELIFQAGNRHYTLNGQSRMAGVAPFFLRRVFLVPVAVVIQAFAFSVGRATGVRTATAGASTFVITPCHECGGSGGSGGNGGSGGSGGATPVTTTITSDYGLHAQPLVGGLSTGTWCNVPHAPSLLGGFALGSCTAGPLTPYNNPAAGVASVGASVFGVAGGEADQSLELAYTSKAPAGVTSTVTVQATVDTANMTYGISGAGGSCAPTQVNAAGLQPGTDTLSSCLGTFQAVIPLGDVASVTSAVMTYANGQWSNLNNAQQACLKTTQTGTNGEACAVNAANVLMNAAGTGASMSITQSPPFTYTGTMVGGSTTYFSVDPEAQVADVGLGTEINFVTSWVVFVVTEQYTESEYGWTFPVAEVGQPLLSNWLEQCGNANPLSCTLVAGTSATVSGDLPSGMTIGSEDGDIVLTGSPAAGTEGQYQFNVQVAGGSLYNCALAVGPPLALEQLSPTTTYTYETGVGFANAGAFALPFTTTGGVGPTAWNLVGGPVWLQIAYSPPTSSSGGGPPVLTTVGQVPTSGTYSFRLQAWDDYKSVTSPPLQAMIVPPLTLPGGPVTTAFTSEPFSFSLANLSTGGVAPVSWAVDPCSSCGALPAGVTLNPATGLLSGEPSTPGTYHFVVVATDSRGVTADTGVTIGVTTPPPLAIQPSSLPAGSLGTPYSVKLTESGSGGPPFSWTVAAGKLPPGLGLTIATGKPYYGALAYISGKPTQVGSFTFSLRLTDGAGKSVTSAFTIHIT